MPREHEVRDDGVERAAVLRLGAAVHEAHGRLARLAVQEVRDAAAVEALERARLRLSQRRAVDASARRAREPRGPGTLHTSVVSATAATVSETRPSLESSGGP